MAKKGQEFIKYSNEFRKIVVEYSDKYSIFITAEQFNIPIGTIKTWRYKRNHKGSLEQLKRGRTKSENYKEKYQILKKFLDFYMQQRK
ncbi:hypothetical protein [Spiroplasma endosymbiont of Cantharis nigra]|uniref:hypothetical protein n=1 Tax=Spiroplasma endosymbiont of Cantharis nigra TaxID=3066278 RepID=UPI0030CB4F58